MERPTLPARCLPFPSLLRLKARTFAVLCPVRFCGHPAFYCLFGFAGTLLFIVCPLLWTPRFYCCPLLWTPRFYRLSTFVDTALFTACPVLWTPRFLLPVRFCGHPAFIVCPLLWTPRLYCLSGFVDTAPLLPVHFCGHFPYTAAQNSSIMEFL